MIHGRSLFPSEYLSRRAVRRALEPGAGTPQSPGVSGRCKLSAWQPPRTRRGGRSTSECAGRGAAFAGEYHPSLRGECSRRTPRSAQAGSRSLRGLRLCEMGKEGPSFRGPTSLGALRCRPGRAPASAELWRPGTWSVAWQRGNVRSGGGKAPGERRHKKTGGGDWSQPSVLILCHAIQTLARP